MCNAGGFYLMKFICNRKNILMSILDIHRTEGVKDTDLVKEEPPMERASRVNWNVEKDTLFQGEAVGETKKLERYAMLSSFYDSLGLASPFILKGRLILQKLCQEELQCGKQASEEYVKNWEAWERELYDLEKISFGRCIKPWNYDTNINNM